MDVNDSHSHDGNILCDKNSKYDLAFNKLNPVNLFYFQSSAKANELIKVSKQVPESHSEALKLLHNSTDTPIKGESDKIQEKNQEKTSTASAEEPSKPANNSISLENHA
ncbi:hypothetical protein O181_069546 [Austropuccinia psidii MF-1]|uniref:Uncharacterized protein n=1 Tax=Austropuccinia psidii MF-1 TaxID=1389203 RepID=A0A9Q3EWZ5_9BASI|nr:hypothetical protein [Austropuccinia psidii MF-1]